MRLNFDQDTLKEAIVGYKLAREAFYKIPDVEINVDELRVKYDNQDWLNDLCIKLFNSLIKEDKEFIISSDVSQIRSILEEEDYDEFHRSLCFEIYEEYLNEGYETNRLNCDICRRCDDCEQLYETYIKDMSGMCLCKRKIKLIEGVDASKILDFSIYSVANIIDKTFIHENIILDVTVCESSGDIVIEYLYDGSGYRYERYMCQCIENAKMLLNLILGMEGEEGCA